MKALATIVTAVFLLSICSNAFPQSEHAKKIAESYKNLKGYEDYATDMLVNKPDYVVFVPKQNEMIVADTYNDHFQVITKDDGTLLAFWTQAKVEADNAQHIAFSKSVDKGLTWSEPQIIAGSANFKNPALVASWQQPMVSKSGRIYCLWNQQTTNHRPHIGQMFGVFSDNNGESWSAPKMVNLPRTWKDSDDPAVPPAWCNWQRPLRLGKDGKYFVGCSRHGKNGCSVEFWQYENIDDDPPVENIKISYFNEKEDQAFALTPEQSVFPGHNDCEEAAPVKLPDGRLFVIMRTDGGYPYWSQSRDEGVTWSAPQKLLDRDGGTPFLHPRSPAPLYDWKGCEAGSGFYFALVHNTFNFNDEKKSAWQNRGPLFLIAGKFMPDAEQPIWFAPPQMFAERKSGNSFYTSYSLVDGKGVLWFNDHKFFLLGRVIGPEWFQYWDEQR
ncbi:MAG: sialidase family protein [Planctomycetia bacterium]|nr:sialidase family protein [Planctomycetia bacterium]